VKTTNVVRDKRAPDPGKNARSAQEARERVVTEAFALLRSNKLTFTQAAERAISQQPGAYWSEQAKAFGSPPTVPELASILQERQSSGRTPSPPIFEPEAQPAQKGESRLAQILAAMKQLDQAAEERAREIGLRKVFPIHEELAGLIRAGRISGTEAVVRLMKTA
jgi:hypothetical protein